MEQALVFASIIVGVAVSDQVLSLNRLLRSDAPVKWHWAIPLAALIVLLTNVRMWWAVASQPAGEVSIGEFLPFLVEFILLALLSAATLPDQIPDEGIDLRAYYERSARYIWLLFAASLVWLQLYEFLRTLGAGGTFFDWLHSRSMDVLAFGVLLALAFVRRWWVDALGIAFLMIGPIGWLSKTL